MVRWAIERPYQSLALVAGAGALLFLATIPLPREDGLVVGSDGIYYFANLRSLVLDGNLQLHEEFARLNPPNQAHPEIPKYTIGMAVLWAPFYLVVHLLVGGDGFGVPYQAAVSLGTIFYGFLGMAATFRLLREWFAPAQSLLATLLMWVATPAGYYMVVEGSMTHVAIISVLTGLLMWWRIGRDRPAWQWWGGMGVLAGIAAMVRPQDGAWILIPALALLVEPFQLGERLRNAGWLATGAVLGYLPQAVVAWIYYGSPLKSGYLERGEGFIHADDPRMLRVLFDLRHGVFLWHWILLIGALGLILMWRRDRRLVALMAVPFLLEIYLSASWQTWWAGDSFGHRMLLDLNPVLAIGLGAALTWMAARSRWRRLVPALAVAAVVWNGLFALQYRSEQIHQRDRISWHDYFIKKVTIIPDLVSGKVSL